MGDLRIDALTNGMNLDEYMKTPCNHKFHEKCLKSWMQVKLECPTCRRELPPIIQEIEDDEY